MRFRTRALTVLQRETLRRNAVTNNVRLMGLVKLLGGALIFAVILAYFMQHGLKVGANPLKIIGPAVPGAVALVGLVELCTGMHVTEVASKWNALAGWQRGILGTLVVAVAFVLMLLGVMLFA